MRKSTPLVPLTELVPYLSKRLICLFRDHEAVMLVRWSPEISCINIICRRCRKDIGHFDMWNQKRDKEELH